MLYFKTMSTNTDKWEKNKKEIKPMSPTKQAEERKCKFQMFNYKKQQPPVSQLYRISNNKNQAVQHETQRLMNTDICY